MTALPAETALEAPPPDAGEQGAPPDHFWRRLLGSGRGQTGGGVLLAIVLVCIIMLPFTAISWEGNGLYFDKQIDNMSRLPPQVSPPRNWFGTDTQGRSILGRCLLGGVISLAIGLASATISVLLGVTVGLLSGYRGGWVDAVLMRIVDILYGLPYILLLILFKIAVEPML